MMTNANELAAPHWNIAALARAWRMDESPRRGRCAVRVVTVVGGGEWLATKAHDGRWWPVAALANLPRSAWYREAVAA